MGGQHRPVIEIARVPLEGLALDVDDGRLQGILVVIRLVVESTAATVDTASCA